MDEMGQEVISRAVGRIISAVGHLDSVAEDTVSQLNLQQIESDVELIQDVLGIICLGYERIIAIYKENSEGGK